MSSKTNASSAEALRAHAQACRELSEARKSGKFEYWELYRLEDNVKKWFAIYTDPLGAGRRWLQRMAFVDRVANPDMVVRQRKNEPSILVPRGTVIMQIAPPRTGKTERAEAWRLVDPLNRRVVDGDRDEAHRLAGEGYDVMLNLLEQPSKWE